MNLGQAKNKGHCSKMCAKCMRNVFLHVLYSLNTCVHLGGVYVANEANMVMHNDGNGKWHGQRVVVALPCSTRASTISFSCSS